MQVLVWTAGKPCVNTASSQVVSQVWYPRPDYTFTIYLGFCTLFTWSDNLRCCHFDSVTYTQITQQCFTFHHTFTNAWLLSHQLANNQKTEQVCKKQITNSISISNTAIIAAGAYQRSYHIGILGNCWQLAAILIIDRIYNNALSLSFPDWLQLSDHTIAKHMLYSYNVTQLIRT